MKNPLCKEHNIKGLPHDKHIPSISMVYHVVLYFYQELIQGHSYEHYMRSERVKNENQGILLSRGKGKQANT